MSTTANKKYFIEECTEFGSQFGLEIKEICHDAQSPYQHIAIYDTEHFGKAMVNDGFFMLTTLDNFFYHEMMSHPILFTHPHPENIAIIGGGDCGVLKEVLKHDTVKSVCQVEIDEQVTKLAMTHFPELCVSNDDPRAELRFEDGIQWLAEREANSLDVIIVDSTDELGPAEGLFSAQFYESCYHALRADGLIIHQSGSPLYHLESMTYPMQKEMKKAGFQTCLTLHYPQPCYPSGWWSSTMASKDASLKQFREADAKNKSFETQYYNEGIHRGAISTPPFMSRILDDEA